MHTQFKLNDSWCLQLAQLSSKPFQALCLLASSSTTVPLFVLLKKARFVDSLRSVLFVLFEESKACWQSARSVFSCPKKKRWVGYSLCAFALSWPKKTVAFWVRTFICRCRSRALRSWCHRSLIRYLSIVQFVPLWAIRLKQFKLWLLHQVLLAIDRLGFGL